MRIRNFSNDKPMDKKPEDKTQETSKVYHNFDLYDELLFMTPLVLLRKWRKVSNYLGIKFDDC